MRQMSMDLLQAAYGPTLLGGAMIGLFFGIFGCSLAGSCLPRG